MRAITAGTKLYTGERDLLSFPFSDDDFTCLTELIYRFAGISLSLKKKDLVYSRLARRLRVRRLDTFAAYIKLLESNEQHELEEFINALTTNMTSFFREAHHFEILAGHLQRRRNDSPVSIWTCAASTGEEPYSIAMTVVDAVQSCNTPARILATDIDTKVLKSGEQGVYPLDQLQKLQADKLKRFFLRGSGGNVGYGKVRDELRQMITFRKLNLLDESWPMREKFDAIFCRNVMIYFDRQTQESILTRLAPYLKPDGLLFVGHSESFHHSASPFKLAGKTVYTLKS